MDSNDTDHDGSDRKWSKASTSCVMRCLATVHALQRERGHTALALALKDMPKGQSCSFWCTEFREVKGLQQLLSCYGFDFYPCAAFPGEIAAKCMRESRAAVDLLLTGNPTSH